MFYATGQTGVQVLDAIIMAVTTLSLIACFGSFKPTPNHSSKGDFELHSGEHLAFHPFAARRVRW